MTFSLSVPLQWTIMPQFDTIVSCAYIQHCKPSPFSVPLLWTDAFIIL